MENFEITIASLPDREKLVAEIYYKNCQWAEISQEGSEMIVQFYSPSEGKYWEFPFEAALEALKQAKKRLLGLGSTIRD